MDEERFDYEVDDATRFVDNLKDRVHDLYDKNEELKEEIERLNKGYCKFKEQCGKYATCLRENQIKEIERLNNIINELEDILKRDIKACNNKFENMFDRNYRKLILEEKLEQLQELKGSNGAIPPEVMGTNGEDGGLFDYGDR